MVKEKRKLKKIAKGYCKGLLKSTDNSNFMDINLSEEEIEYVVDEVSKIADRITDDSMIHTTKGLKKSDV